MSSLLPPRLTADPGWARLLAAARRRLERSGGDLHGSVSLVAPTEPERLVVIGVTGTHRSVGSNRLTVRLTELDAHLQAAYGFSLADLVAVDGPLRNRPGEARQEAAARAAALAMARDGRYAGASWYEEWLEGLRCDGTLTRVIRSGTSFAELIRVLDELPAADEPLPAFADRVLDDTKALTDGPLRGLVLRAVACWQGLPVPANAQQERALWESVGVVPDDLASQVLVLNVPASGGPVGSWLTAASRDGIPLRITLYQLRLGSLRLHVEEIFVCENPAVLRTAVRFGTGTRPLICTEGVPSAATHALLAAAPHAVIRWRNDFDWPGVRLTAAALNRYPQAVPWRMGAADYGAAAGSGPALLGTAVETPWDPVLQEDMRRNGRAVMEERLIDPLLRDLRR
jgi:uncharacterized protein (TIGR02679 family)